MATPSNVIIGNQIVGGPKVVAGTESITTGLTTLSLDFSSYGAKGVLFVFYTFEAAATKQPLQGATTSSATSTTVVFNFGAPGATATLKYIVIIR